MDDFVDLSRRFRDLTPNEIEDPELLVTLGEFDFRSRDGWTDILAVPRLLILAEAGSGKTYEMRAQASRLQNAGRYAFFVPLEQLGRRQLSDLLSAADQRSFECWKTDSDSLAYFFLDAVDELKLTERRLEEALGVLAKALDDQLDRAHVIVSSRPTDWRPHADMAAFKRQLPYTPRIERAHTSPDEFFRHSLNRRRDRDKRDAAEPIQCYRTVALQPLNKDQIELYATHLGVRDAAAFVAEIQRENAWDFACRPLDCSQLIAIWNERGELGTRLTQHEANITIKIKEDPDRLDRGVLSEVASRDGTERLALALTLSRMGTVLVPDRGSAVVDASGALDSASVLPDWSEEERSALLRRAIFDPATYGRVRFHHSSVQHYLAACRLMHLVNKGMKARTLRGFLFAHRYGVDVVIPSMRPIAAWLAGWNDDVSRELMSREPETLLSMGDPGSLTIDARANLLRAFASLYGDGGRRGLDIPSDQLRRLAHPDLADTVRELWGSRSSEEIRELLLELIWHGRILNCADIAERAALNGDLTPNERVTAVRAIIACERKDAARRIVEGVVAGTDQWPVHTLHSLALDLFPDLMAVSELMALVKRAPPRQSHTVGFDWALQRIVDGIDPWGTVAIELRDQLAELIVSTRDNNLKWHQISGQFDKHATSLAMLCDRQLTAKPQFDDAALITACAVANRFGQHHSHPEVTGLRKHFANSRLPRRAHAFWRELALLGELVPESDHQRQFYHLEHQGLIGSLSQEDRPWLEAAASDPSGEAKRGVALMGLIWLWAWRGRLDAEIPALIGLVADHPQLHAEAVRHTASVEPDPELRKFERNEQRHRRIAEGRDRQRIEGWVRWRDELLADLPAAFAPANLPLTIRNFYKWLDQQREDTRSRFGVWNSAGLVAAYGQEAAELAATAFKQAWRTEMPKMWSERKTSERNSTPYVWIFGLCGLSAEAETDGWARRLTTEEARIAVAYATIELNSLPEWLMAVADVYPTEVMDTLEQEVLGQLGHAKEDDHLPLLQMLTHAPHEIKKLLAPRILANLRTWPSPSGDNVTDVRLAGHLSRILRILIDGISEGDRAEAAALCVQRFVDSAKPPSSLPWLRALFKLDAQKAALLFSERLQTAATEDAIQSFAALFGDSDGVLPEIAENTERARVLAQLVRAAYRFVRREDDQRHESAYTPGTRDHAEQARNILLSALVDTPGSAARVALMELADDPLFAHMADRLRMLARQRAATDAEPTPLQPDAVALLEKSLEHLPCNRDELFNTMMDRLDDLAHNIAHDDFTDRATLQSISHEPQMQRVLAGRLRETAKGAYQVTREEEVADSKETDIRLRTMNGAHRATIEVKIADKWSIRDLETALTEQLVGQYLRHISGKAGCLLLTYHGDKQYWEDPASGRRMSFEQVVEHLIAHAKRIEAAANGDLRLGIFAIDLRPPLRRES